MTAAEYVPSEDEVRDLYALGYTDTESPTWRADMAIGRRRFDRFLADVRAKALEDAADTEAAWTNGAWHTNEADTVVKLRKGLRARAARIREEGGK